MQAVEAPHRLEFEDGFADDAGAPNPIETRFPSAEAMEQVITMGMEEGMTAALGHIDELLGA